jgi:alpha-L-rhamnosidase
MPFPRWTRRLFTAAAFSALGLSIIRAARARSQRVLITNFGSVPDSVTVNTTAIQRAIDQLAANGGGTLVVPKGIFVSGALFLKPGVNLHLERGAVLRCSTDMTNFPPRRTRIEGHFEESFTPALINAKGCNGLRISGEGTLDGAGQPVWDRFWQLRNAAPDPHNFPNLGVPRARLALIEDCTGVLIEGITFKDSQFWNLHLYRCNKVLVRRTAFVVPDDYRQAPSTDGIDLDSCRNVTVDACYFSVTDDCIAAKGSKGPYAMEDRDSPPVEHLRIRNCHFRRGHHALACGSEATIVRDVRVENCRVTGDIVVARLKLRPDTPQRYEDIHFRNIALDHPAGAILMVEPWTQYRNLNGEAPPHSIVRNISFTQIRGRFGAFGTIHPNPGQTDISDILFKDIDVRLTDDRLIVSGAREIRFENVIVNGRPVTHA